MADLKISQLTSATALVGTEVVPVVQSGTTKKATINQILKPAAGNGIDYSANTPAAGMTSQLLDDYEEGTFTATLTGFSTPPTTPITTVARYTKIGRQVYCQIAFKSVNTTGALGAILVQGLPFTAGVDSIGIAQQSAMSSTNVPIALIESGSNQIQIMAANVYVNLSFTAGANQYLFVNIPYTV